MAEVCFTKTKPNELHRESKNVFCSVFTWRRHDLAVYYQMNSMDVDVLSWYEDGTRLGYRYL
uniref:Uncharacterized protein n=1 Tax=viral metagenome TaxID=1070528 RepID=A0A6C0CGH2_9ZZZZ